MNDQSKTQNPKPKIFWRCVAFGMHWLAQLAAVALGIMIVATCLDVILRRFKVPLMGTYDVVCICAAIAIACALPKTTAAKGHIAIEYFFHKLNRTGRRIVDIFVHGGLVIAFLIAMWQCLEFGHSYWMSGEGSQTLRIPLFWVPWVMAFGFLFSAFSSLFHLLHPGKTKIIEN